ncbi:MAG: VPLPA-CTERM sorting domain-containing protein [Verrucomicrobia bacterium]|nr:VPLPA-CTERM sorting domain-containing protein [Verrucomicrobiota bacterium]
MNRSHPTPRSLMKKAIAILCLSVLAASVSQADTVIRGFDEFLNGSVYFDQYPEFSITTDTPGATVSVLSAGSFAVSAPNIVGGYIPGAPPAGGTIGNLLVEFHDATPLYFKWLGDETGGDVGDVWVYESGVHTATLDLISDANHFNVKTLDLTAYANVTRIDIKNITDLAGLAFDNFAVNTVAAVPEPASLTLLAAGCAALGMMRRRRV